jgi:hypothetical protein
VTEEDISTRLQRFFRMGLDGTVDRDLARGIASSVTTEADWVSCLRPTVESLKNAPERWSRAALLASVHLDPPLVGGESKAFPSRLLLRGVIAGSSADVAAFLATIEDEQALYRLIPILPELDLDEETAVAVVGRCAAFRNEGESPAGASELTEWARRHAEEAKKIVASRLARRDNEGLFHVWGVEPLVEGVVRAEAIGIDDRLAWRDATIATLLQSPNTRRQGLAVYLSCVAWPEPRRSATERQAPALALARRSPAELLPPLLQAVMRDVWEYQEATFETLEDVVELVVEAGLSFELTVKVLRQVADIASRGLGTLKDSRVPEPIKALLPYLQAIPPTPSARDHMLDFLLDSLFKRDRELVESFLLGYLRVHAPRFVRMALPFNEAFPLLSHSVGAGLLGTWLVNWMVDLDDALRTCAAIWAGTMENVRPSRGALGALTQAQAQAVVHVALTGPVRGETVFALVGAVAETRDDVADLVRTTFLGELATDYPGLTRRWVEEVEAKGTAAKPEHIDLANELRERQLERDRVRAAHEAAPELYATSACQWAWMDVQQQIMAAHAQAAERSSVFAQIVSKVHVVRGEAMSHSFSREPQPFVFKEFSYEERVRRLLDPIALDQALMEHLRAARQLLSNGGRDEAGA